MSLLEAPLPDIPSLKMARDFLLACFLAEGTRAGDMMIMRTEHIMGSNLVFRQMKTSTRKQIFIVPELDEIFDRYKSEGPFLFPYLNREEVVDEARKNTHVTVVNKYLKELAKYCGIFKKLSTHVAPSYLDGHGSESH